MALINILWLFFQTGAYMYLEANGPFRPGHSAKLISPIWSKPRSLNCTLSFWYHMLGKRVGQLAVHVYTLNVTWVMERIRGNQGYKWRHSVLSLVHVNSAFQVRHVSGETVKHALADNLQCQWLSTDQYRQNGFLWLEAKSKPSQIGNCGKEQQAHKNSNAH